ncbi:MAG: hypothetical protein UHG68_07975 [Clostridia bacterium]|nr:hypothetical protein [Clostridia bacterium]
MDNNEQVNYTFKQKLDNFFYHYKWHVIIGAFLCFVLIWVIFSSFFQKGEEAYIGYIGDYAYSHEEKRKISDKISAAIDLDLDGDGECAIEFRSLHYLSAAQVEELAQKAEKLDREFEYHPVQNEKNYENFVNELETGDTAVWLVSKEVYEMMDKSSLMSLQDILGYTPEGAVDEYALDCADLDFATDMTREIKYNSYLIMRVERDYSFIMGEQTAYDELEDDKALFKAVAEYKKS